jgi:hypothetical protein
MFTHRVRRRLIGFITFAALAGLLASPAGLLAQSSPLTIQPSTGRVGIGTTNPTEKLDVTGNIKSSGSLSVGTTAQTGTANRFRYLNSSARADLGANQSIPDSTFTDMDIGTIKYDTDGLVDLTNNQMTVTVAGKYLLIGNARFMYNGTGVRIVRFIVNGSQICETRVGAAGGSHPTVLPSSVFINLAANDVIKFQVWQNSGGNLAIETAAVSSWWGLAYLGE